jgi:phosphatidylinositol-binding clathrin assembly protein
VSRCSINLTTCSFFYQVSSTPKKEEPAPATSTAESSSAAAKKRPASIQPTIDLLGSIEESQPTMFNPHTNSPSLSWVQQQPANPAYNPFRQSTVLPQMTGMPTQPFVAAQPTGFGMPSASPFAQPQLQAQVTGMPFQQTRSPSHQQPFGAQAAGAPSMPFQTGIMQPQPTGFLQPQAVGSNNPFRQSMAFPQMNAMPNQPGTEGVQPRSASAVAFLPPLPQNNMNSGQPDTQSPFAAALINQPASTSITGGSSNQNLKPVVSHQIGSRNPFRQPKAPSPPPLPKPAMYH